MKRFQDYIEQEYEGQTTATGMISAQYRAHENMLNDLAEMQVYWERQVEDLHEDLEQEQKKREEQQKQIDFLMENAKIAEVISIQIADGVGKIETKESSVGDLYNSK